MWNTSDIKGQYLGGLFGAMPLYTFFEKYNIPLEKRLEIQHDLFIDRLQAQQAEQAQRKEIEQQIQAELDNTVSRALKEIFKDFP